MKDTKRSAIAIKIIIAVYTIRHISLKFIAHCPQIGFLPKKRFNSVNDTLARI